MITKLIPGLADSKAIVIIAMLVTFAGVIAMLKLFKSKLPTDLGRDFAFNGKLSAGKTRGAGIVFVCVFIVCSAIFISISPEYLIYYLLYFAGMLSGYLDDRSDKPWGEYKKGIIDLVISLATAWTFVNFNPELTKLNLYFVEFNVIKPVFIVIGMLFVWAMINATNCSDGIDGLCGSLSINSLIAIFAVGLITKTDSTQLSTILLMIFAIFAYLWFNCEPSTMLMGDAGSRAIGLFLAVSVMKTGNILLAIPVCFIILLDGLIGILKIVLIRFLKINALKKIRTPLHDHFRKNKSWSNTQVIYRFHIIQVLISALTIGLLYK